MPRKFDVSCVYCIMEVHTNKKYVGGTTKFHHRKSQHLLELRKGIHPSKEMQKDFLIYGEDSFVFFILEKSTQSELIQTEQKWIDHYSPEYNSNQLAGNHFHPSAYSEDAKEKVRTSLIGRKQSEETKAKRAESIKKFWSTHPPKTIPQEMREHLSKINTGKKNPNWGLKRTPKQLQNMSEGRANILYTFKSPDGELVTVRNLYKCTLLPYGALRNLYRGKTKEHKGWTFVGSKTVD